METPPQQQEAYARVSPKPTGPTCSTPKRKAIARMADAGDIRSPRPTGLDLSKAAIHQQFRSEDVAAVVLARSRGQFLALQSIFDVV
jgi:hypothetical protein